MVRKMAIMRHSGLQAEGMKIRMPFSISRGSTDKLTEVLEFIQSRVIRCGSLWLSIFIMALHELAVT